MMDFLITNYELLITFVLGTAIGSFLNVWSRRLLRDKPPIGRSRCEHCGHVLGFLDLIPLLSFAALRGRCRYCHKPLSWQYPIVELGTGLLFATLAAKFPNIIVLIPLLIASSALITIFITDISAQVIFDQTLWIAGVATFFYRLFLKEFNLIDLLPDLFTAFLVFLFFVSIRLITKKRGLGEGDPPLGFVTALLVGFPYALVELFLAFVGGGAVGTVLVLSGKNKFKDRIAFGPFLVLAVFATIFFGEQIWNWYLGILGL
jgi:leader peptidase (prepilin peptidase)/N-methyltransferase